MIKSHNDHDSQQKLEIKEPKTFTHPQRLHMLDGHHFRNDSESDTFCDKAIVSIPDRLAEYNFFYRDENCRQNFTPKARDLLNLFCDKTGKSPSMLEGEMLN